MGEKRKQPVLPRKGLIYAKAWKFQSTCLRKTITAAQGKRGLPEDQRKDAPGKGKSLKGRSYIRAFVC